MGGSRNCPRQFSFKDAKGHRADLFALLSAELRFNCEFGARCCAFHQARSRLTGDLLKQLANRKPRARSGARLALIRSPSSSLVTGSFARQARWEITAVARLAKARGLGRDSHRGGPSGRGGTHDLRGGRAYKPP